MTPESALKHFFALDHFRAPQRAIIDAVMDGKDSLVVMPTGGGKSLCFQLPAMLLPGVTLVVSPLIALMKDQVDALRARGLPAGLLNSTQSAQQQQQTLESIRRRELKLVYVAPERFRSNAFLKALPKDAISLFAIDEAHCLSQWGHDFRPDYMRLGAVRKALGNPVCIALTATATPDVQTDIKDSLQLIDPSEFVAGFARENLSFRVRPTPTDAAKLTAVERLIRQHRTGIVYCATRKSVEAVVEKIRDFSGPLIGYHGGLSDSERTAAQEAFMQGHANVVVATNAFGMGIDRADIRFVCHYEMPGSVEAYYQEGGRAGRDGQPAVCELLFSYADKRVQDFFIEGANPGKALIIETYEILRRECDADHTCTLSNDALCEKFERKVNPMAVSTALSVLNRQGWIERFDLPGKRRRGSRVLNPEQSGHDLPLDGPRLAAKAERDAERLKSVISFAYASTCRQLWILDYFGEQGGTPCKRCDVCVERSQASNRALSEDESTLVRKALSGVARMCTRRAEDEWTARFGKRKIIQCLMGSQAASMAEQGLDQLSTYGILQKEGAAFVDALFLALERGGLIETVTRDGFPLLQLSELGSQVMRGAQSVELEMPERTAGAVRSPRKRKSDTGEPEGVEDPELYQRLAEKRLELARASSKPAFTILPNFALVELANRKPTSPAEAIRIRGIGPAKLNSVVPHFLEIIERQRCASE